MRPLSCLLDENTPVSEADGATCSPVGDPRVQERRVRSQRHRNYMSRTHLHTHPELPEGYGEWRPLEATEWESGPLMGGDRQQGAAGHAPATLFRIRICSPVSVAGLGDTGVTRMWQWL